MSSNWRLHYDGWFFEHLHRWQGLFCPASLSLESDFHNLWRSSICKWLQICIGNPGKYGKLPAMAIVSAGFYRGWRLLIRNGAPMGSRKGVQREECLGGNRCTDPKPRVLVMVRMSFHELPFVHVSGTYCIWGFPKMVVPPNHPF